MPYSVPVRTPSPETSPAVSSAAPYTPAVMNLIAQLEPDNPPTASEVDNADQMLIGASDPTVSDPPCHNVGDNLAPLATTPAISPLCWSDGVGINVLKGPNEGMTTASPALIALGASFDTQLANAWGQVEGTEGRELMVTGLLGPQVDTDVYLNWGRDLDTAGEDPLLSGAMGAAEVNGMQGVGLMSQVKHLAVYNGQGAKNATEIQDQALHQQILPPYQMAFGEGGAAATMCSYQIWQDDSSGVPSTGVPVLYETSPYGAGPTTGPTTWPLNEMHYSCEQPLTLTDILRDQWGSQALIGPDYPAVHSAAAILQGVDMEPESLYFGTTNVQGTDPTGDTCADSSGDAESCTAAGAVHVGGLLGTGCGNDGCAVGGAAANGVLPISVFDQALATMLYQEQRFGLLGCDDTASSCSNPGGVAGNRSGTIPLPTGPTSSGAPDIGTLNGDAAISEKMAEEGAVLLKNNGGALPLTTADLQQSVAVSGGGAEYLIADPNNESAVGVPGRDAIDPLQQLEAISGDASAFTYSPAGGDTGEAVPASVLSTSDGSVTGGLSRTTGPGSPTVDPRLDFTTVSGKGQLAPGSYTWTGYVYVPTKDTYAFRMQFSPSVPPSNVTLSFDGKAKSLIPAVSFYTGEYYGKVSVPTAVTNAGYTQAGLTNEQCQTTDGSGLPDVPASELCPSGQLSPGYHAVTITFDNETSSPASFRFGYSRVKGDIADAAAAARGKAAAIVFANDAGRAVLTGPTSTVSGLQSNQVSLIEAVAAANPNTIVVLNTGQDIVTKPWINLPNVKVVLEMWNAGQEGGTATARLLLGLANPSGHTPITWPVNGSDTIYGYDQAEPLYPGDTSGTHPERASLDRTTNFDEGIFNGYRYYDKLAIPVQFPFGFGLSYSTFAFSRLNVSEASDGGLKVSFSVQNTSSVAGAEVPQVYVGPPSNQPAGVQFAVRSLAQFSRISLNAGARARLTLEVSPQSLEYWSSSEQQWVPDTGTLSVYVGDADELSHLPLQTTISESPAQSVACTNEQIDTTTIAGNLLVPNGDWCDLVDVTVDGSIIGNGITGLRLLGSTVKGDVDISQSEAATDPLSEGSNTIGGTTVDGNLTISGSSPVSSWSIGTVNPDVVEGNMTLTGDQGTDNVIANSQIGGQLVCGSSVGFGSLNDVRSSDQTGTCS